MLPSDQAKADPERKVRGQLQFALPADVAEMMGAREWNHTGRLTPRQRPFLLSPLTTATFCAWLAVVDGVRPNDTKRVR
jgi:hypothetical protein